MPSVNLQLLAVLVKPVPAEAALVGLIQQNLCQLQLGIILKQVQDAGAGRHAQVFKQKHSCKCHTEMAFFAVSVGGEDGKVYRLTLATGCFCMYLFGMKPRYVARPCCPAALCY